MFRWESNFCRCVLSAPVVKAELIFLIFVAVTTSSVEVATASSKWPSKEQGYEFNSRLPSVKEERDRSPFQTGGGGHVNPELEALPRRTGARTGSRQAEFASRPGASRTGPESPAAGSKPLHVNTGSKPESSRPLEGRPAPTGKPAPTDSPAPAVPAAAEPAGKPESSTGSKPPEAAPSSEPGKADGDSNGSANGNNLGSSSSTQKPPAEPTNGGGNVTPPLKPPSTEAPNGNTPPTGDAAATRAPVYASLTITLCAYLMTG